MPKILHLHKLLDVEIRAKNFLQAIYVSGGIYWDMTRPALAINSGESNEWPSFLVPGWRDYNQASLEEVCTYQWITTNTMALEAKEIISPQQWIQLRCEDMFEDAVEMFSPLFKRLGIEFDHNLETRCAGFNKRPTSKVKGAPKQQKWKTHNPEAIERTLEKSRPLMQNLGYDEDD